MYPTKHCDAEAQPCATAARRSPALGLPRQVT